MKIILLLLPVPLLSTIILLTINVPSDLVKLFSAVWFVFGLLLIVFLVWLTVFSLEYDVCLITIYTSKC